MGTSQIPDPNTRDKCQQGKHITDAAWREVTKSVVELAQDLATEIDRESNFLLSQILATSGVVVTRSFANL